MSNLLEKASIILTPTAYNDGEALCVKPTDGSGDFDFSRNSAATRVNSQGLVENVQTISGNLLDYSTFTSTSASWSLVGGLWVYDDTANGYLVTPNLAVVVGDVYDVVVDVTIASGNANFRYTSGNGQTKLFNYTDFVDGVNEFQTTVTGVDGVLQRLFASVNLVDNPFTLNSISIKKISQDTNLPRINYEGGCGSWLFEPQSTNLFDYSEDFSDSFWTKDGATITSNSIISPDGTQNGSTLVSSNTTSQQLIKGSFSVISGDDYSVSVFAKKKDFDYIQIRFEGRGAPFQAGGVWFNIDNGTLGTQDTGYTGTITDFGNGWYRCTSTAAATSSATATIRIQLASSDNSSTIVGNGTDGTYIWGAQSEALSFPSSYIPTSGTSVTRNQDVCTNGGSLASINSSEGVLYFEGSALIDGDSSRQVSLSDATNNNLVQFRYDVTAGRLTSYIRGNAGAYAIKTILGFTQTNNNKIALVWNATSLRIWINGTESGSVSTNDLPIAMDTLNFTQPTGGNTFFGKTKCLAVWKEALSDAELTSLTTI